MSDEEAETGGEEMGDEGGETGGDAASGDEGGRGAVAAAGSLLSWLWGGARGGGGAEADPLALQADVKAVLGDEMAAAQVPVPMHGYAG